MKSTDIILAQKGNSLHKGNITKPTYVVSILMYQTSYVG